MRSGVSTASLADDGTFAVTTGTEDSDYPATNAGDLFDTGEVARIAPDTGTVVIERVLSADASVQFLALVEHNIPSGGAVQVEVFDDDSLTSLAHDTGTVTIPDPTSDPQTFPVLLDAAITARSIRVTVTGLTDDLELGGLEIGQFWEWPWITAGLEAGFDIGGSEQVLAGGGSYGAEGEDFRTRTLQVSYLDLAVSSTTGLDFQKLQGLTRPFVYVEDYDAPASFPRDCFLAVNEDTPLMSAAIFDKDNVQFRLRESR